MNAVATSAGNSSAGRVFLALGFIATTLVTTLATVGGNYFLNNYQVTRTQKIVDVNKFVDTTQALNPLIRDFMDKIDHGEGSATSRELVAKNIQLQDSLLDTLTPYVSDDRKPDIRSYRVILVRMNSALETADKPLDAAPFMQSVADSLPSREVVIGELRASAGLPGGAAK